MKNKRSGVVIFLEKVNKLKYRIRWRDELMGERRKKNYLRGLRGAGYIRF